VTEYFEGTMPTPQRLSFERHIAICPPCRGYLSQLRQTLRVAGALTEESLSPEARAELLTAFRDWRSAE
jgi:hypothetical protein